MAAPKKHPLPVHIRFIETRDRPAVLDIENRSFEGPWDGEDFARCLRQHKCNGIVAEHYGRIVGYTIYEKGKKLRIINMAVHPDFRRQDIGAQMMEECKTGMVAGDKKKNVELQVRETNLDAQLFFKAMGFEASGEIIPEFYENPTEAAYTMEYDRKKTCKPEKVYEARQALVDATELPWKVVRIIYEKPKPIGDEDLIRFLKAAPQQLAFQCDVELDAPQTVLKTLSEHFSTELPQAARNDCPGKITLPLLPILQARKRDSRISLRDACTPHDPADQKLEGFRSRVQGTRGAERQR